MARRRHVVYPTEFRVEAVRRVRHSEESLVAIAADLGIAIPTLRRWVEASRAQPDEPLSEDERSELARLRKEVRELRMEREILKKATAFFAKDER